MRLLPTTTETESEDEEEFEDEEGGWDGDGEPLAVKLYQNYPNPLNPSTTIGFRLGAASLVTVTIYSVLGQEAVKLRDAEALDEGYNEVEFTAGGLASGTYFYTVKVQTEDGAAAGTTIQRKILLLK